MALSVTLPGSSGGIVTVQSGSGDHIFLAQIIANTILQSSTGGSLNPPSTVTINGGAPIGPSPTPPANSDQNILYMYGTGGTTFAVPSQYNYVVDLMTGPETITGANVQIVSYDPIGSDFELTGNSSVAADPATDNEVVSQTGTANIATGTGNDTISLDGAGTVDGGGGSNVFNVTPTVGGTGIRVQSEGTGDAVTVSDPGVGGVATVVGTGSNLTLGSIGLVTIEAQLQGDDATVTGGIANTELTTSGSNNVVLGGSSGTVTYVAQGQSDTIAAFGATTFAVSLTGSGGTAGTGELLIGGTGALSVNVSNVFETIGGGSGSTAVTIQGIGVATDEVVLGGTGSLTVDDQGQNDTVAPFGSSSATITLGGANDLLFGGSNTLNVTVTGTNDTVASGAGPETITANTGAVVFGNSGLLSFVGGAGTSSIVGAAGDTNALTVGAGGVIFWTGGNDTSSIVGGSGQTTLLGASGSKMYFSDATPSDGGVNFSAGDGNETLNASLSTTNNFYALGGDSTGGSTVVGGSGDDTFTAGAGADSMVGGTGDDSFVFFASQTSINAAGAHDYITDWTSKDALFLLGYDPTQSANSLMAASTVSGGNLTIKLSDNTEITFNNVTNTADFNGKILYT